MSSLMAAKAPAGPTKNQKPRPKSRGDANPTSRITRTGRSVGAPPSLAQCPHGIWEPACNSCKPIHVGADQAWKFTYPFSHKDQVQIHSKGQFNRECRKRGLRHTVKDELTLRGTPYHAGDKKLNLQAAKPIIEQVIRESKQPALVERKYQQLKQKGAVK